MWRYFLKRILLIFPTLFGISIITFIIIKLAPGDPTAFKMGNQQTGMSSDQNMAKQVIEQTREIYGLDKPLMLNFTIYNYEDNWAALQQYLAAGHPTSGRQYDDIVEPLKQADEVAVPFFVALLAGNTLTEAETLVVLDILTIKQKLSISSLMSLEKQLEYVNNWWYGGIDSTGVSRKAARDSYQFTGFQKFKMIFTEAQYPRWLVRMMMLDFGNSIKDNRPVWDHIKESVPVSLIFTFISFILAYMIAIPLGIYSATHQYTTGDKVTTVILFILYSLPNFWVATMAIVFFGGGDFFDVFPVSGLHSLGAEDLSTWEYLKDLAHHVALPLIIWTYGSFSALSRYMRGSMLEVIRQDYIRTARAKGLSERVVTYKHALRNSLIPIITMLANLLPLAISGSIIIESIFSIPGMGQLSFNAVLFRDYPVIMAVTTISAMLTLSGILLSDLLYAVVDPRITFEEKR
ncbi:MAG: ABC transporter permease [Candidatus Marinimicrobia bacterium]|nr:ABC transporter permease [Candidatus Neomarinimicrobiota bacterium]